MIVITLDDIIGIIVIIASIVIATIYVVFKIIKDKINSKKKKE